MTTSVTTSSKRPASSDLSSSKVHNKSGKSELWVLTMGFDVLGKSFAQFSKRLKKAPMVDSIIWNSPHQFYPTSDGRITVDSVKVCYAYQLVALHKFGTNGLAEVLACKDSQKSLVISHLCGEMCVTADHLVIEPKQVNDERTHHHFVLLERFQQQENKKEGVEALVGEMACKHEPKCGAPL
jgi:hypothetical protein